MGGIELIFRKIRPSIESTVTVHVSTIVSFTINTKQFTLSQFDDLVNNYAKRKKTKGIVENPRCVHCDKTGRRSLRTNDQSGVVICSPSHQIFPKAYTSSFALSQNEKIARQGKQKAKKEKEE